MRKILTAILFLTAGAVSAQSFSASLSPPWDGVKVPEGQQCHLFGGNGATPEISVQGLPDGTAQIRLEFNDKSYAPLSENGGHGVIGFMVSGADAVLPSVPGSVMRASGNRGGAHTGPR